MSILQRLRGTMQAAKNSTKGLTLIEFSIVLAMTIALIGLTLNTTGAFSMSDKYYMKKKVESAFQNFSVTDTTTLDAASGGNFESGGLFGSVLTTDASVMFTSDQINTYCKVLRQGSGKVFTGKEGTQLTYGQVFDGTIEMMNSTAGTLGICSA